MCKRGLMTVLEVPALEMVSVAPVAPNANVPRVVKTCGGGGQQCAERGEGQKVGTLADR